MKNRSTTPHEPRISVIGVHILYGGVVVVKSYHRRIDAYAKILTLRVSILNEKFDPQGERSESTFLSQTLVLRQCCVKIEGL